MSDAVDLERRVRALERGAAGSAPVRIGTSWRLVEEAWPTTSDPVCALIQRHMNGDWTTVLVISPAGTILPP
ncbi:MAG TPA: hypothetical protein VIU16_02965 [Gaiellaceae bacterium]